MIVDTKDMVSVTEAARRGVSWLVEQAASGRTMVVLRGNQPVAVIQSLEAHADLAQDARGSRFTLAGRARQMQDAASEWVDRAFPMPSVDDPAPVHVVQERPRQVLRAVFMRYAALVRTGATPTDAYSEIELFLRGHAESAARIADALLADPVARVAVGGNDPLDRPHPSFASVVEVPLLQWDALSGRDGMLEMLGASAAATAMLR